MEITGLKKIKPEKLLSAFEDYKQELKSQDIKQFTYDDFVEFVNRPENENKYLLVAYKWHMSEQRLEEEHYGCQALCVFKLFMAFSNLNGKSVVDDNGKIVKIINKIGKNKFELID